MSCLLGILGCVCVRRSTLYESFTPSNLNPPQTNTTNTPPLQVLFGQKLKWPSSSISAANGAIKEAFRRRLLPGVHVRYIDDPSHLLRGQYGVYATREFNVRQSLIFLLWIDGFWGLGLLEWMVVGGSGSVDLTAISCNITPRRGTYTLHTAVRHRGRVRGPCRPAREGRGVCGDDRLGGPVRALARLMHDGGMIVLCLSRLSYLPPDSSRTQTHRRFEDGAGELWGVDSGEYGNEIRMINHFRGIGPVPNIKLVTTYVNELPHILAVVCIRLLYRTIGFLVCVEGWKGMCIRMKRHANATHPNQTQPDPTQPNPTRSSAPSSWGRSCC